MAISKIVLNNTTQIDLTDTTAVASDVASGKYFYGADGVKTVGTASSDSDIPTFTMTFDENGEEVISITCDKTFAECLAIHESYGGSESPANVIMTDGGTQFRAMASGYYGDYGILRYVLVPQLYADIIYNRNNGITYSSSSQYPADVRIIKNGTYNPKSLELYKPIWGIEVNVPNSFTASDEGKVVSGGALVSQTPLSVTANGTYTTTMNNSVVVNVSGGGGDSAWTKIAERSYEVSTTANTTQTVATIITGHSELWTANKWVYVRIRDTAGKRDGYFFGSDQFFYNVSLANGQSATSITTALRIYTRYSGGTISTQAATGTGGYGVWADTLYSDGRVRIRKRYNSSYSLTINGTYKVEIYLLDPADGVPIFG